MSQNEIILGSILFWAVIYLIHLFDQWRQKKTARSEAELPTSCDCCKKRFPRSTMRDFGLYNVCQPCLAARFRCDYCLKWFARKELRRAQEVDPWIAPRSGECDPNVELCSACHAGAAAKGKIT